jgi:hypothetical protein
MKNIYTNLKKKLDNSQKISILNHSNEYNPLVIIHELINIKVSLLAASKDLQKIFDVPLSLLSEQVR